MYEVMGPIGSRRAMGPIGSRRPQGLGSWSNTRRRTPTCHNTQQAWLDVGQTFRVKFAVLSSRKPEVAQKLQVGKGIYGVGREL